MQKLIFDKQQWEKLQQLCEQGYPKEVCGLLFGKTVNGTGIKKVQKVQVLTNILDGSHKDRLDELLSMNALPIDRDRALSGGNFEFMIDPVEHYHKVRESENEGLDQVGIFHSHPDHPAKPSKTDESQPFLAGWSQLIVAVHAKKFLEAKAWYRESESTPFQMQDILIE
mgnify:FL=1